MSTPPKLRMTGLFAVAALAGCSPPIDRVPEPVEFEAQGSTYAWTLAHGVTGSLSMTRMDGVGRGFPEVIMTCDGVASGGLQIRDETAASGPLGIAAPGATFSAPSTPAPGLANAFSGKGEFPPGWFDALASAETLTISYGGKALEVRGPGERAVAHYRRYCEKLDRRNRRK